jgi:hypothetical protein
MAARAMRDPLRLSSPHPHASDAVAGHGVRRAARDGSPNQPWPASTTIALLFWRPTMKAIPLPSSLAFAWPCGIGVTPDDLARLRNLIDNLEVTLQWS